MEFRGGEKGKENDRKSTISNCITSLQVEGATICTEHC
jgi:hypothetical protein